MSANHATRVIVVDPDQPDPTALDTAAEILRQGGLVAFATETVYGLGAIATDPASGLADLRGEGTAGDQPRDRSCGGRRAGRRLRRRMARDGPEPGRAILARSAHARPQPVRNHPRSSDGRPRHRRSACSRREGRTRPHRTDGPADRGTERQPGEPNLAHPRRACAGRSRWSHRPDHRQRADDSRPGINGPRPDHAGPTAAPTRTDLDQGTGSSAGRERDRTRRHQVRRSAFEPRTDAGPLRARDPGVPRRFIWRTRRNGLL